MGDDDGKALDDDGLDRLAFQQLGSSPRDLRRKDDQQFHAIVSSDAQLKHRTSGG